MQKKIKKLENKPRKKYEFKSEKTKKMFVSSTIMGLAVAAVVCALSFGGYKLYASKNTEGLTKNATGHMTMKCTIPYTYSKCRYEESDTIRQIKIMLNKINKVEEENPSLYFDKDLVSKVKAFQKSQRLIRTGTIDSYLVKLIAKKSNTNYYQLYYNKNLGTGTLQNTSLNTQTMLNGISTEISSTKLKRKNKSHVGYTAMTVVNGKSYYYGCDSTSCAYPEWFTLKEKRAAKKFNMYVLYPESVPSELGWKSGQRITLTAKYCPNNNPYYNQEYSICTNADYAFGTVEKSYSYSKDSQYEISDEEYPILENAICKKYNRYTGAKKYIDELFDKVNSNNYPNTLKDVITEEGLLDESNKGEYVEIIDEYGNPVKISQEDPKCEGAYEALNDTFHTMFKDKIENNNE